MILILFSRYFYYRSGSWTRKHPIYTLTMAMTATVEATVIGLHLILKWMKKHLSFRHQDCLTLVEASSAAIMCEMVNVFLFILSSSAVFLFAKKEVKKGSNVANFCEEICHFVESLQCSSQNIKNDPVTLY